MNNSKINKNQKSKCLIWIKVKIRFNQVNRVCYYYLIGRENNVEFASKLKWSKINLYFHKLRRKHVLGVFVCVYIAVVTLLLDIMVTTTALWLELGFSQKFKYFKWHQSKNTIEFSSIRHMSKLCHYIHMIEKVLMVWKLRERKTSWQTMFHNHCDEWVTRKVTITNYNLFVIFANNDLLMFNCLHLEVIWQMFCTKIPW